MGRPPLPIGTWGRINRKEVVPGRWRATARFRHYDGLTRSVEAWGATGAAAERALLANLKDRATPSCGDLNAETRLSAMSIVWFEEITANGRVAPQTLDIYHDVYDRLIAPGLGGVKLREFTTGRVDRFIKSVAKDRPALARQCKIVLNAMLSMAVRHDAIPSNPVRDVGAIRQPKKDVRALTVDDIQALRQAVRTWQQAPGQKGPARAPDLLDVVDILLATGARIGEVLAIRWDDLDLAASPPTLTISGTLTRIKGQGLIRQHHPKTASGFRTVSLPGFAVETLLRIQLNALPNPYNVVFPSTTGSLRSPNNFRRQWRDARTDSKFEWVTPHVFRKTVATLIDREYGSTEAAAQLGHSGTAVTERHYIQKSASAPDMSGTLEQLGDTGTFGPIRESSTKPNK